MKYDCKKTMYNDLIILFISPEKGGLHCKCHTDIEAMEYLIEELWNSAIKEIREL